jgi:hypothetical protein
VRQVDQRVAPIGLSEEIRFEILAVANKDLLWCDNHRNIAVVKCFPDTHFSVQS